MDWYRQLRLLEGIDIDDQGVLAIIETCVRRLGYIGLDVYDLIGEVNGIQTKFSIDKDGIVSTTILGECCAGILNGSNVFHQEVVFNKLLYKQELIPLLESNIYHELCHAFTNIDAIKAGVLAPDPVTGEFIWKNNGPELVDDYRGNGGHDKKWLEYADLINRKLSPAIPVTAHPSEEDFNFYITTNQDMATMKLVGHSEDCSKKDLTLYFEKDFKLMVKDDIEAARIIARMLLAGCACAECKKPLHIEVYDEDLLDEIPDFLKAMMLLELRNMFEGD